MPHDYLDYMTINGEEHLHRILYFVRSATMRRSPGSNQRRAATALGPIATIIAAAMLSGCIIATHS